PASASFLLMAPATPDTHPLSLHDALPILFPLPRGRARDSPLSLWERVRVRAPERTESIKRRPPVQHPINYVQHPFVIIVRRFIADRKSTRLNSSHVKISYAVFCLKKKTHT